MANTAGTPLLIAFESTHAALAAQKLLDGMGIAVIPTPREITANCGMSLRVPAEHAQSAQERIAAARDVAAHCSFYAVADGAYRLLPNA